MSKIHERKFRLHKKRLFRKSRMLFAKRLPMMCDKFGKEYKTILEGI